MMAIADDSYISEYQNLTTLIHEQGVPVLMQLTFVGRDGAWWTPQTPEQKEIHTISRIFGEAAYRAKLAGFDGVQFHLGHGFFLSQFQNRFKNTRTDEYGGQVENRARIILEIYDTIRVRVGSEFAIAIKINCGDFETEDDGVFETCQYTCDNLALRGIQAIEITGGVSGNPLMADGRYTESIFRDYAAKIADQVQVPIILVGKNRDPSVLTELLNTTRIEYFSLSRPLIRQPDLMEFWQKNPGAAAECTSCDACRAEDEIACPFR